MDGRLLFNSHAFPLPPKGDGRYTAEGGTRVGYTDALYLRSNGGITASGCKCEHLTYLVEFGNFGGTRAPGQSSQSPRPSIFTGGLDEITWFARQPESYRNEWLRYAWKDLKSGLLQMHGSRILTNGPLLAAEAGGTQLWYFANARSEVSPHGSAQEEPSRHLR